MANISGLKIIALVEATKGALALLVGLGLHALAGKNIQAWIENLAAHLHLNPANKVANAIINEVGGISYSSLSLIALGAVLYSLVRFVEAYGLWKAMCWTEWFAFISGAIYLPIEIYELIMRRHLLSALVFAVNVIVVLYMYTVLRNHQHQRNSQISP